MFTQEQHQLIAETLWSIRLRHYPSELPRKTYENMVAEFASRLERDDPILHGIRSSASTARIVPESTSSRAASQSNGRRSRNSGTVDELRNCNYAPERTSEPEHRIDFRSDSRLFHCTAGTYQNSADQTTT